MKIMLADDELSMRQLVRLVVEDAGYAFCEAVNGKDAIEVFEREHPDLAILDVMMPKVDGYEVCEHIRSVDPALPVLFLTAKGDIVDKKCGFKAGADDYMVKPFAEEELLMRIEALTRRRRDREVAADWAARELMLGDGLELDIGRRKALLDGQDVGLTPKEFDLLMLMALHPGEVYRREELVERVWGEDYVCGSIGIAVYVRRIREKIERDASKPCRIKTVWGVGYYFESLGTAQR